MNLNKYIKELLLQYDCVVVPDFGGFVCSFSPAKIHPVQHRFTPPAKKISFNKLLTANDGLLVHHIAIANNISYEQAHVMVHDQVTYWKQQLSEKSIIEIKDIGSFKYDISGNILFDQDQKFNFLTESYGLASFQSLPIERKSTLKLVHDRQSSVEEIKTLPSLSRMAKYSVAAALLSIVALTTYKLDLFKEIPTDTISLNPFKSELPSYSHREYPDFKESEALNGLSIKDEINKSNEEVLHLSIKEDGIEKTLNIRLRDKKIPEVEKKVSIGKFHVVGGCFGVESNANKLLKRLQKLGYKADASVIHNGLRVVSYQSFNNRNDAQEFLTKVKVEQNKQAWLLVK